MYVLLKSWVSCLFLITEGWIAGHLDTELFQSNKAIEFVYYPQKIPWISARRVCQSIGGDFAKIDSQQLLDEIIRISLNNYGYDIFSEEYWIGLVEIEENQHFWVNDCSNLTYTSKYSLGYDPSKLCYRLKKDHTAEKRVCTSNEGYMCQRLTEARCNFITDFHGEVLSVGGNMSTCPNRCSEDTRCWGTVEHVPDSCVLLALPGFGVKSLNFTFKTCYDVILNETIVVPDLTNVTASPDATCGPGIEPTPSNSTLITVTAIANPPCEPVNITQNVTLTMTEYVTTQYNITTTEQLTVTSNVTTTSTETTTSVSVSSFTVTSTVIQTSTQNITIEKAEEVAKEIVKNLTIDAKSTSSHIRRLTSAEDNRKSAMFVGYIGVIAVVVPLGIMLIADVRKLFLDFRDHSHIYKKK